MNEALDNYEGFDLPGIRTINNIKSSNLICIGHVNITYERCI